MWWRLFWWIITTALTDLLTKRPPDATPAGVGDFGIPTATEGRVVQTILGGTIRVNAPNCVWYGDYATIERTQETGVIIKSETTIGFTYELALQYALFKGQAAGITALWIGDEKVYSGPPVMVVDVDRDDLYGGKDMGGGFIGRFRLHDGDENQAQSAFLTSRITEGLPAYRGTCYIMVTDISETKGAEIGESPNLRYINVEVQTFDTVANGGLGDVLNLGNDHHFIGADANPISVAYDMFTNERWGRGLPVSDIDLANFRAAAEVVWLEGIGFSMLIDEFSTTEAIQDNIEQHVDGYIGPNAITGQFEISLARPDYVLAAEYQANESNIVAVPTWNKGDWSQTFNRVRIRYADRNKDWDETHAVANAPANRIIQGRLVSQEVRYPGVHEASVANTIVAREKKNLSRPARSGTVELNRTAWELRPGNVFSFTHAGVDEFELPCRITKVEIGDPINNTLVVEVVEDIFDNEVANVAQPPPSDFVPPIQLVTPLLAADQASMEAPYMMVRQDPLLPNVYPRMMTVARRETGSPTEYEVRRRDPSGSGSYVSNAFIGGGFMTVGLLRNAEVGWLSGNGGKTIQVDPVAGSLDALIGPQSPTTGNMTGVAVIDPSGPNEEWVIFSDIVDDLAGIRLEALWRGSLDTGQKVHLAGERIWFIWTGGFGLPSEQFAVGASLDVKLLPRSPTDAVDEGDAIAMLVPFLAGDSRYLRPLLPKGVYMNGNEFATLVDFDTVYNTGGGDFLGARISPLLRDWRNQAPVDQVNGGGIRGDIWGDDEHQLQYWLYNLLTDPVPSRGDAVINVTVSATFASDGIYDILRSAVEAEFLAADSNSLPMRLETETSHIPGAGASRMVSKEVMLFDFTGTGAFLVAPDTVYVHLDFAYYGDGTRKAVDVGANQFIPEFSNTDSGATSATQMIGTRSMRFGEQNADTYPVNTSAYARIPNTGPVTGAMNMNQNFTVEFRLRLESSNVDQTICGQYGGTGKGFRWIIKYDAANDRFEFIWSSIGTSLNIIVSLAESTAFIPTPGTWYAFMLTRQLQPNGSITFRWFRDGIKVAETNVASFTISSVGIEPDLSLGSGDMDRTIVSGPTGDGISNGWVDEFRILVGVAAELIDYTVPVANAPGNAGGEYLPMMTNFRGEAGRDLDRLTQDVASGFLAWVYDGAFTACHISAVRSRHFGTSLFIDGTQDAGLRWGNFEPVNDIKHQYLTTSDFCVEGWVNFAALPSTKGNGMALAGSGDNGGNARQWFFGFDENDELEFAFWEQGAGSIGAQINILSSGLAALNLDQWYHIAVQRTGNLIEAYVDGTRVINDATFFDNGGSPHSINNVAGISVTVGKAMRDESGSLHRSMNGYIDSFRMQKHSVVYTGASFVPDTEPFLGPIEFSSGYNQMDAAMVKMHNHFNGEDANGDPAWLWTKVLLEFEGTDTDTFTTDESPAYQTPLTWTFQGTAQIDTAQSAIGGSSLLLNGTTDYIQSAENGKLDINAEDFSIDGFVRFNGDPGTALMVFMAQWDSAGAFRAFWFGLNNNQLEARLSSNGTTVITFNEAWDPAGDTWYHVAVSRQDGAVQLFVDGVQLGVGVTDATNVSAESSAYTIGAQAHDNTPTNFMNGWIDQMRMTIGDTALEPWNAGRYPDGLNFQPPTAARSKKWHGDFPDDLGPDVFHIATSVGAPLIDQTQKKFGSSSLYLDGSSYITYGDGGVAPSSFNFVIDCQVRFDGDPGAGNMTIASEWNTQFNARGWLLALRNNELVFEWDDSFAQWNVAGAWNPADATWYHVMVSKVAGVTRIFVDGLVVGEFFHVAADRIISDPTATTTLGCHLVANVATDLLTGWIDEFRAVVGTNTVTPMANVMEIADFTPRADEYDWHRCTSAPTWDRDTHHIGLAYDASVHNRAFQLNSNCAPNRDRVAGLPAAFATIPDNRGGGQPGAMEFNGNAFIAQTLQNNDFFLNSDFTIMGWWNFDDNPATVTQCFYSHAERGTLESMQFRINATLDALELYWTTDGINSNARTIYADVTLTTATWYHIAVARQGDTVYIFLDGVLLTNNVGSDTMVADESFFLTTHKAGWNAFDVDFALDNPASEFDGACFDMRFVKGKAMWTSTFTLPAVVFPENSTIL